MDNENNLGFLSYLFIVIKVPYPNSFYTVTFPTNFPVQRENSSTEIIHSLIYMTYRFFF